MKDKPPISEWLIRFLVDTAYALQVALGAAEERPLNAWAYTIGTRLLQYALLALVPAAAIWWLSLYQTPLNFHACWLGVAAFMVAVQVAAKFCEIVVFPGLRWWRDFLTARRLKKALNKASEAKKKKDKEKAAQEKAKKEAQRKNAKPQPISIA